MSRDFYATLKHVFFKESWLHRKSPSVISIQAIMSVYCVLLERLVYHKYKIVLHVSLQKIRIYW